MSQNEVKEAFFVSLFDNRAFVVLSIIFLLLVAIASTAAWYWGLAGRSVTAVFSGCVIFIWIILSSMIHGKKLGFSSSSLIVESADGDGVVTEVKVESCSAYFFVLRKIGFIFRIFDGSKSHFFFVTSKSFLNWEDAEKDELDKLIGFLRVNYPSRRSLVDALILAMTYVLYPLFMIFIIFSAQKIAYFLKY